MNLHEREKIAAVHEKALVVAENYRRSECELIDLLIEFDDLRGYLTLGYSSLFEYSTRALKLSGSVAYSLIQVARKSKTVPEIKDAIAEKTITLSHARRIAPVINSENKQEWISKAQTLSVRELDKALADKFPKTMAKEEIKYTHSDRANLTLNISEETLNKLKRIQDLLSQKKARTVKLEETLEVLTEEFIQRHDPVVKADRILSKTKFTEASTAKAKLSADTKAEVTPQTTKTKPLPGEVKRNPLPAQTLHQIHHRDHGQCSYIHPNTNYRCPNRRWLDIHHTIPKSQGGSDSLSNLQTLCRAHHKAVHFSHGLFAETTSPC